MKTENVILITIDALRADHLSCLGYCRKTTPRLDEFAKKGILFSQAISVGSGTTPSFPSILTSSYPLMYGGYERLSKDRTTIAEVLKSAGYSTAAFHSNPYLSRYYGYDRGFDTFEDFFRKSPESETLTDKVKDRVKNMLNEDDLLYRFLRKAYGGVCMLLKNENIPYEIAEVINEKAFSWLKEHSNNNFFLWVHYMDVHEPGMPPYKYLRYFRHQHVSKQEIKKFYKKIRRYSKRVSYEELKMLIDLYDCKIRYVDYVIGSLLDELENMDIMHNTLIVVTADHGDEFLEHGELGHHESLYDELLHVPLLIYAPEIIGKNIVIEDLVSLLDLSPTILDILDTEKPKKFIGKSLLAVIKGKERRSSGVISEVAHEKGNPKVDFSKRKTSYRTEKWKFILDRKNGRCELYNLQEDPMETKNLAEIEPDLSKEFESKIRDHILREKETMIDEREKLSKKIKELKSPGKI